MLVHGRPDTGNKVINVRILTSHAWHQSLVPDIHGQVGPHNLQQTEVARVDAPLMRQHARKCAQQRLRARSPTQGSGGPTGRWRGNARATAAATHTQLNSHPSCIDHAPSPSYPIALKLSKSIEHLWYDASPANQGAAAP